MKINTIKYSIFCLILTFAFKAQAGSSLPIDLSEDMISKSSSLFWIHVILILGAWSWALSMCLLGKDKKL